MAIQDKLLLLGISYKTAHVDVRERFSVDKNSLAETLSAIKGIDGVEECVLLSTCNRTELYVLASENRDEVLGRLKRFFLDMSGMDDTYTDLFYVKHKMDVVDHLFHVTSGLDSLIFGEPQIFGQIKIAYSVASDSSCTGPVFNRLFHFAFQTGKQIRSTTSVQKGIVSLSSAAVMLAKKTHGNLNNRNALLIGTGKVGKMCAKQLVSEGIDKLYITNRTPEHALELAGTLSGILVPYESMKTMLDEVDVVVTSVSSPDPILNEKHLRDNRKKRLSEKIVIIDLGVPRNVDENTANVENVHLFNIDDMESVTEENHQNRKKDLDKAKDIIKVKVGEFSSWMNVRDVAPVINDLHDKCESIRKIELERLTNKVDDKTFEAMDILSRRIVRKILHHPTIKMRTSETGEARDRLLDSINELFISDAFGK